MLTVYAAPGGYRGHFNFSSQEECDAYLGLDIRDQAEDDMILKAVAVMIDMDDVLIYDAKFNGAYCRPCTYRRDGVSIAVDGIYYDQHSPDFRPVLIEPTEDGGHKVTYLYD